jgi:putative phage-type endonuclease
MSQQGSDEWLKERAGKITASMVDCILAKDTTASYQNYQAQIVAEIITGEPAGDSFSNAAMIRGTELEPLARICYEFMTGNDVTEVGFVNHRNLNAGASPDGEVGADGLVEIKCRTKAKHISYLINRKVERKEMLQMQLQMACTGREWCDFVSYCPELGVDHQICIIRVERDPEMITLIETAIVCFMVRVHEITRKLETMKGES